MEHRITWASLMVALLAGAASAGIVEEAAQCDASSCGELLHGGAALLDGDCPDVAEAARCDLDALPTEDCIVHDLAPCPGPLLLCKPVVPKCFAGNLQEQLQAPSLVPAGDLGDAYSVLVTAPTRFMLVQWPPLVNNGISVVLGSVTLCVIDPAGNGAEVETVGGRAQIVVQKVLAPGVWTVGIRGDTCGFRPPPPEGEVAGSPDAAEAPFEVGLGASTTEGTHGACYPMCIAALPTSYSLAIAPLAG